MTITSFVYDTDQLQLVLPSPTLVNFSPIISKYQPVLEKYGTSSMFQAIVIKSNFDLLTTYSRGLGENHLLT